MNIYRHEIRTLLKSVITWSLSLVALIGIFMAMFPSFAKDAALMQEMMQKFPKELLIAFGMTDMDMSSILGFYALIFLFCQLCLAVQAANYGFSMVSIEERELTADFLLAKPVKRTTILTAKLLAALSGLTITNLAVWVASFVFITMFNTGLEYNQKSLVLLLLSIILFQLFFLSVGLVISLLVKRVRSVTPYAMALAFGMYILDAFTSMIGDANLEVISPFKHFDANYIVNNTAYDLPLVSISVVITLISIAVSYLLYQKRNIATAN